MIWAFHFYKMFCMTSPGPFKSINLLFPSFKVTCTCTCIFNLLISCETLDVRISVATDEIHWNGSGNSVAKCSTKCECDGSSEMILEMVAWQIVLSMLTKWSWSPSIHVDQNFQYLTGNGDVLVWVKNSRERQNNQQTNIDLIILPFLSYLSWNAKVSCSNRLLSVVRPSVYKLFTFSSSSPEPLVLFQPNLAQSIVWLMGFNFFFQMMAPPFSKGR